MTAGTASATAAADGRSAGSWEFFTPEQAAAVAAMAARIIPSEPGSPGAAEAGAVTYIDRTLAGPDHELGPLYREGTAHLDLLCRRRHRRPFAELGPAVQDRVLAAMSEAPAAQGPVAEEDPDRVLARLFAVVWEHTIQGVFGDPAYGGNRDCVGWKLIGFPGAQWGYTARQMQPGFDAATIQVQPLAVLRRTGPARAGGDA